MPSAPEHRWTVADGFVGGCLLFMAVLACLPERWLVDAFAMDDGFYYPRVAMNIVAGRGVTYDGRTLTNGFHPLWEAALVPLAAVSGGDPVRMMRLVLVLSAALVAAGALALRDVTRRLAWGSAGLVVAVALLVFTRVDLWMCLLESGPSMAVLLGAIAAMLRWDLLRSDRPAPVVGLGLLLAAVFLVRLDFVFLSAAWLATGVVMRLREGHAAWSAVRSPFLSGVALTIACLPYLVANQVWFGSIVPVSGRRKTILADSWQDVWTAIAAPAQAVGGKLHLPAAVVVALGVGGLAVAILGTRPSAASRAAGVSPRFADGGVLPGFVAGVAIRFLYLRTFMSVEAATIPWYWVPETVLVCLVAGWTVARAVDAWRHRVPAARALGIAGAVALFGLGVAYVVRDAEGAGASRQPYYDAAAWVRERATPATRCAMVDSGTLSWYSRCDTVSVNGLIGDEEVMRLANEGRYTAIVQRHDSDYLVWWAPPDQYAQIPSEALLYESPVVPGADQKAAHHLVVLDARAWSPWPR